MTGSDLPGQLDDPPGRPEPPRWERVAVAGGELAVAVWGPAGAPLVLAVHGITANALSWAPVAEALLRGPEPVRVIAPDLRGRGWSAGLPGPYGLDRHAEDLEAVLAHFGGPAEPSRPEDGGEQVTVVGHSMGAFVAVRLATRRIGRLVLVDGGLPLELPEGVGLEQAVQVSLGPALERLAMRFASVPAYHTFWRGHPALAAHWSPAIEDYVEHDLVGEPPGLRSSVVADAVRVDSADLFEDLPRPWSALPWPVTLLTAPRGLLDQNPGLYPPEVVRRWEQRLPGLVAVEVDGTNHYTVVLSPTGVAAVVAALSPTSAA